jgi:hypothetical protein
MTISLLFPSPVLPGSGSKGMISVLGQNTPKAGIKVRTVEGIARYSFRSGGVLLCAGL